MPNVRVERALKVGRKILQRMYAEATPSADFEFLVETFKGTGNETWMEGYVLRSSRQMGIVEVESKGENLTKTETIWMLRYIAPLCPMQVEGQKVRKEEEKRIISV